MENNFDNNTDIYFLGLSNRALFALNRNNIYTIGDLLKMNHYTLSKLKGVGDKTRVEIMKALSKNKPI